MGLENITTQIDNNVTLEEHESQLVEKILGVQFQYISKVLSGDLDPLDDKVSKDDLKQLILQYSQFEDFLQAQYRIRKTEKISNEEWGIFLDDVVNSIVELYKKNPSDWLSKIKSLVNSKLEAVGLEDPEIKQRRMNRDPEFKIGPIEFQVQSKLGQFLPGQGFGDDDYYISLHFPSLFATRQQKQQNPDAVFNGDPFVELARRIVNKYPYVKAIVGKSWMMSLPSMSRRPFTIIKPEILRYNSGSFWGQFVDGSGQIKTDMVKDFLNTGKAPYETQIGYIKVEDFLRKYLPDELRGSIKLKNVNSEMLKIIEEERNIIKERLKQKWDISTIEEIEEFLNRLPIFHEFLQSKEGAGFLSYIRKLKNDNKTLEEIKQDPLLLSFEESFDKFCENKSFVPFELTI